MGEYMYSNAVYFENYLAVFKLNGLNKLRMIEKPFLSLSWKTPYGKSYHSVSLSSFIFSRSVNINKGALTL